MQGSLTYSIGTIFPPRYCFTKQFTLSHHDTISHLFEFQGSLIFISKHLFKSTRAQLMRIHKLPCFPSGY